MTYVHPMYNEVVATKTERLNLRLTPAQDTLLRRAAGSGAESVSDYVLRHAVEAAERDLADRRVFVLGQDEWQQLQRRLNAPARPALKLRGLIERPSRLG